MNKVEQVKTMIIETSLTHTNSATCDYKIYWINANGDLYVCSEDCLIERNQKAIAKDYLLEYDRGNIYTVCFSYEDMKELYSILTDDEIQRIP